MSIQIQKAILQDPKQALELEWLETNGLGGWSSSSIIGCNTRNYHGILIAAVKPPTDRYLMLSRLDESLIIDQQLLSLATRDFGDTLYPQGFQYLTAFNQSLFPSWNYQIGNLKIKKTLLSIHLSNSVCIRYELLSDSPPLTFYLDPFIAARYYHSCQHARSGLNIDFELIDDSVILKNNANLPNIIIKGAIKNYKHSPCWHNRFFYLEEQKRGLGAREDLICSGRLELLLCKEYPITLLISCENNNSNSANEIFHREIQRRESLFKEATSLNKKNKSFFHFIFEPFLAKKLKQSNRGYQQTSASISKNIEELESQLLIASEQFIVKRDSSKSIIAGYHWFTDWGRDTLIAIRGLCIATGKIDQAQEILKTFCENIKNGLVPNRFVESGEPAEYNTVDASLWLFVAAYEFKKAGGNENFIRETIYPALKNIFESYQNGTIYEIHEDVDGLVSAGNLHIQLTWMDAKIGDWVVTPRHGKAVEINALWYNALNILKIFSQKYKDSSLSKLLDVKIEKTKQSFNQLFWNKSLNCLYDVVNSEGQDSSVRPNQIFAIGLPFQLLSDDKSLSIIKIVKGELLTPRGLRTLSHKDSSYRGKYEGTPYERDSAYHQGTVWPWLLGCYIDALLIHDKESGIQSAQEILSNLHTHLQEAGIGTISEIFDGDFPHKSRGSIAQAWSVAEILRACLQLKS